MASTGSTAALPMYFSDLAIACKDNGQFDDARRCIDKAIVAIKKARKQFMRLRSIRASRTEVLPPIFLWRTFVSRRRPQALC